MPDPSGLQYALTSAGFKTTSLLRSLIQTRPGPGQRWTIRETARLRLLPSERDDGGGAGPRWTFSKFQVRPGVGSTASDSHFFSHNLGSHEANGSHLGAQPGSGQDGARSRTFPPELLGFDSRDAASTRSDAHLSPPRRVRCSALSTCLFTSHGFACHLLNIQHGSISPDSTVKISVGQALFLWP